MVNRALPSDQPLLICLSPLRWDFVWQRTEELLSRAVAFCDVLFLEAPVLEGGGTVSVVTRDVSCGVRVAHLRGPRDLAEGQVARFTQAYLHKVARARRQVIVWYCSPQGGELTTDLPHDFAVFDSVGHHAGGRVSPPHRTGQEDALMKRVQLVLVDPQMSGVWRGRFQPTVHAVAVRPDWDATWLEIQTAIARGLTSPDLCRHHYDWPELAATDVVSPAD